MSSIFGAKEAALASTRLLDTPPPEKSNYRFSLIKRLVDKLFPASALNLERYRHGTSPTRE